MTILEGIVLGITQGITEFLPISSSGHLILIREFFGWQTENDLAFDAVLHLATLLAVGVYFKDDLFHLAKTALGSAYRSARRDREPSEGGAKLAPTERQRASLLMTTVWAIIAGSVPAVFFGLLLEDFMERAFRSHFLVGVTLVVGALLMLTAEWYARKTRARDFTVRAGFIIGLFQSLALIPGMSRSGSTISGGLFMGLSRAEATRFSFLLGFPVLLGAGLKKCIELFEISTVQDVAVAPIVFGFIFAFAVGICAIHFLIKYLERHPLDIFSFYRVVLAVIVFSVLGF